MKRLEAAASWPHDAIAGENQEPLQPALREMVQNDQWIDDFIERLNYAVRDIVKKKP
ncbi:MAG: hypothetical protein ABIL01_01935 [Pseudomonadota bacterium]